MVYYARNNEPFFQGRYGGGLEPDQQQGDNSYPTGLDFSRVKSVKSLRGLQFNDSQKPSNKPRLIKRLTLFNNQQEFEISTSELSQANLQNLDENNQFDPPKIYFSNGNNTRVIKITDSNLLSEPAKTNLRRYFKFNEMLKSTQTIEVPIGATQLKTQLEQMGYKVQNNSYKFS
ncbi:Uncharacterised protein [Mycoplasma putrefaciens]|nr:Uncharacterised protein [Mycoplasma putrefaciens]